MKYIVCGLTASGKTAFAVSLAKKLSAPLINIDSRQVYKYLDIGTNKGPVKPLRNIDFELKDSDIELLSSSKGFKFAKQIIDKLPVYTIEGIEIYLICFLNPDQRMNIFAYKNLAYALEEKFLDINKDIIYVGGTGLYIDAVVKDYEQKLEDGSLKIEDDLKNFSLDELYLFAKHKNIEIQLNESDSKNPRRVLGFLRRYLEGSDIMKNKDKQLEYKLIYMDYDWAKIREKIRNRVNQMIDEGLIDEVKKVIKKGYPLNSIALQGIGYREVIDYLQNKIKLEQLNETISNSHIQYARRQRTWFEGKGRGYESTSNLKLEVS